MSNIVKRNTAELIKTNLEKNKSAIMASLPIGFNYDRMCRVAINAISTNANIADCSVSSLFLSIVKGFCLGLEPNGALQEGYLVPFVNRGIKESVFMPSYRGLINLARRSGEIAVIYARDVCENDIFELLEGTSRELTHKPNMFGDRGKIVGYYAVYKTKDDISDFEIMSLADIEKIRKCSKAANSPAWIEWFDEMAKKCVIKRLLKRAPMSIELANAINQENKAVMEASNDVLDIEGLEIEEPKSRFEE